MSYRSALQKLYPAWLSRERTLKPDGTELEHENRVMFTLATIYDLLAARVQLGIQYAFPSFGTADARAQIGRDRRVLRGPNEPDAAYDARLVRARDDQRQKGLPSALLNQIAGYFTPFDVRIRCVDATGNWVTREPDGTVDYSHYYAGNWNWDGAGASFWARHWIIIYPLETGAFTDAGVWGVADGQEWGDDDEATFGSTLTVDQVESLKRLAIEWRPEGVSPQWIILALDDASFDPASPPGPPLPDGTWRYDGTRLASARYIQVIDG